MRRIPRPAQAAVAALVAILLALAAAVLFSVHGDASAAPKPCHPYPACFQPPPPPADPPPPAPPPPPPVPPPPPPPQPPPAPPPPPPGQVFLSPAGLDSNPCTQAAPCLTLARGYNVAQAGQIVQLAAGTYQPQPDIPAGAKAVTFQGSGAVVGGTIVRASNLTFRSMTFQVVTARPALELPGGSNTFDGVVIDGRNFMVGTTQGQVPLVIAGNFNTLRNSEVKNVTDEKGILNAGNGSTFATHTTLDNVDVHDVHVTDSAVHNECMFNEGDYLTIRNSHFWNCATFDLNVTLCCGNPNYGNLTLVSNVFEHTYKADGTWHFYSVGFNGAALGSFNNFTVVNNTFEIAVADGPNIQGNNFVWANNLGPSWDCVPGATYSHNVGKVCGGTDIAATAFGWVNPAAHDFHLLASSPAVNAADPVYAPATDKDGNPRFGVPDAGAYERQGP